MLKGLFSSLRSKKNPTSQKFDSKYRIVAIGIGTFTIEERCLLSWERVWDPYNVVPRFGFIFYSKEEAEKKVKDLLDQDRRFDEREKGRKEFIKNNPPIYFP